VVSYSVIRVVMDPNSVGIVPEIRFWKMTLAETRSGQTQFLLRVNTRERETEIPYKLVIRVSKPSCVGSVPIREFWRNVLCKFRRVVWGVVFAILLSGIKKAPTESADL